jgi:hypothetical protein
LGRGVEKGQGEDVLVLSWKSGSMLSAVLYRLIVVEIQQDDVDSSD